MIIDRHIFFAFCDMEFEAQRKILHFGLSFRDHSVQLSNTVKKKKNTSKEQSWVYSFMHVRIIPGKEMNVYGDTGLSPLVCSC